MTVTSRITFSFEEFVESFRSSSAGESSFDLNRILKAHNIRVKGFKKFSLLNDSNKAFFRVDGNGGIVIRIDQKRYGVEETNLIAFSLAVSFHESKMLSYLPLLTNRVYKTDISKILYTASDDHADVEFLISAVLASYISEEEVEVCRQEILRKKWDRVEYLASKFEIPSTQIMYALTFKIKNSVGYVYGGENKGEFGGFVLVPNIDDFPFANV
jgi:hypothetical protein